MRIHTGDSAFWIALVLAVPLVTALAMLPLVYRYAALKRSSQLACAKANQRIRETDDVTNQLLQGVQGLLLTFHVAAQKLAQDHVSRQLMEHALSEADELVSVGRRRFEQVAFETEADAEARGPYGHSHAALNLYLKSPERESDRS